MPSLSAGPTPTRKVTGVKVTLSEFITVVKGYINREDPSDALVTQWVRMAESSINKNLRCKEMHSRETALFMDSCSPLPPDWIELSYVKFAAAESDYPFVRDGKPIRYVTPDEYWRENSVPKDTKFPHYTIIGDDLFVSAPIDPLVGVNIHIGVYRGLPPLGQPNWLITKYPQVYLYAALTHAYEWAMEPESSAVYNDKFEAAVTKINDKSNMAAHSGSPLRVSRRSFG